MQARTVRAPAADGVSLRAMTASDLAAAQALTSELHWPHRPAEWEEAFRHGEGANAEASVGLDERQEARGFAMRRRFGRGHAIGPVVAPDVEGAKALIAHLAGANAGRFTRIDIDFASGLAEWVESLGLLRVDAPTTMLRGPALVLSPEGPKLHAIVTQAIG